MSLDNLRRLALHGGCISAEPSLQAHDRLVVEVAAATLAWRGSGRFLRVSVWAMAASHSVAIPPSWNRFDSAAAAADPPDDVTALEDASARARAADLESPLPERLEVLVRAYYEAVWLGAPWLR
jgi:hypothetical protein